MAQPLINVSGARPRIAVIGAGIAGLAAARELARHNANVTLFEKNERPGGRIASALHQSFVFDSGAQNIKSQGTAFEAEMRAALDERDIIPISAPVCLHEGGRILPPDPEANAAEKWTCRGGMARLCEALANGLHVRYGAGVQSIHESDEACVLAGENGWTGQYDHVICALPLPQAADLLARSARSSGKLAQRLSLLAGVRYSRCLTALLRYESPLHAAWYALLARDRSHPLLWLAREDAKGESFSGGDGRAGASLVAQLGPEASSALWEAGDGEIAAASARWVAGVLGDEFREPSFAHIVRWPLAQPVNPVPFAAANPQGSRILFCGDGLSAARVPAAWESGVRAARQLLVTG